MSTEKRTANPETPDTLLGDAPAPDDLRRRLEEQLLEETPDQQEEARAWGERSRDANEVPLNLVGAGCDAEAVNTSVKVAALADLHAWAHRHPRGTA